MSAHNFQAQLSWQPQGKAFSYKDYSREYLVRSQGKPDFMGTAAPAYMGSPYHYNPEDMLVVALSACHMLTYLAYCANSKITVLDYFDNAEGSLHQEGKVTKFKEVILKPKITISKDSNKDMAMSLHEKAHHACFIANSINFPVKISAEIVLV